MDELAEVKAQLADLRAMLARPIPAANDETAMLKAELADLRQALTNSIANQGAINAAPKTQKFSAVIDAVTDIDGAIRACAAVLAKTTEEEQADAFNKLLRPSFQLLAAGMENNSTYRHKPLGHSIQVALTRLNIRKVSEVSNA